MTQSTLLSYVQNSPFNMVLIEVVPSFSTNDSADHVLKLYEKLMEFQALDCDILLLTKSGGGEGGGFLKLVGVPFRLLLDEEQSLARIVQHRQSAVETSGQKAIHILAEISCNQKLNVTTSENENEFGKQGGVVLLDSEGSVLYHVACDQETDWPDTDTLLETVKKRKTDNPEPLKAQLTTTEDVKPVLKEAPETQVTVARKKCCVIM